ncbi:hypothetical protein J7643_19080 [bacterium]|nr:hypothetical protein [bacterium]
MRRWLIGLGMLGILSGCVTNLAITTPEKKPETTPAPTPTPTSMATPNPFAGRLLANLTFQNAQPGDALKVGLKYRAPGATNFVQSSITTTSDTAGNASFSNLADGDYQVVYDDGGSIANFGFNVPGIVVSDPITVTASQSQEASQSLELAWDFLSPIPQPGANLQSRSVDFSWSSKNGVSNPLYQVAIFQNADIKLAPLQTSQPSTDTAITLNLSDNVTTGTRYYVVRYWKNGGSFGGASYYGTTRPIPIVIPAQ